MNQFVIENHSHEEVAGRLIIKRLESAGIAIMLCEISRNRCDITDTCLEITSKYQAAFPISQKLIFGTEI